MRLERENGTHPKREARVQSHTMVYLLLQLRGHTWSPNSAFNSQLGWPGREYTLYLHTFITFPSSKMTWLWNTILLLIWWRNKTFTQLGVLYLATTGYLLKRILSEKDTNTITGKETIHVVRQWPTELRGLYPWEKGTSEIFCCNSMIVSYHLLWHFINIHFLYSTTKDLFPFFPHKFKGIFILSMRIKVP